MHHDIFARLRDNMEIYRAHTTSQQTIAWCPSCEVHHAPAPGELCPVCAEDRAA